MPDSQKPMSLKERIAMLNSNNPEYAGDIQSASSEEGKPADAPAMHVEEASEFAERDVPSPPDSENSLLEDDSEPSMTPELESSEIASETEVAEETTSGDSTEAESTEAPVILRKEEPIVEEAKRFSVPEMTIIEDDLMLTPVLKEIQEPVIAEVSDEESLEAVATESDSAIPVEEESQAPEEEQLDVEVESEESAVVQMVAVESAKEEESEKVVGAPVSDEDGSATTATTAEYVSSNENTETSDSQSLATAGTVVSVGMLDLEEISKTASKLDALMDGIESPEKLLPNRPIPLSFTRDIWAQVFLELTPRSIKSISETCTVFEEIIADLSFQARFHLKHNGKQLVFSNLCSMPEVMTVDLATELVELGAHLPRFLVENLFNEFDMGLDTPRSEAFVAVLPIAYKIYPDLNLESCSTQKKDDSFVYEEAPSTSDRINYQICFGESADCRIDVEELTRIVHKNYFCPALAPPHTESGWSDLFNGIYRLFKQDSPSNESLAMYLANNSGATNPGYFILLEAMHDSEATHQSIERICSMGVSLDASFVSYLLCHTTRPVHVHTNVVKLLRACIPEHELMEYVGYSLSILISSDDQGRVPIIDYLLAEFEVEDSVLDQALMNKDLDDSPFLTTYGVNQEKMSEKLIMLIFSRYGPDHKFTKACFSDLVVGGLTASADPSATALNKEYAEFSMGTSFEKGSAINPLSGSSDPSEIKERDDTMARESISFLLGSGMTLDSKIFTRIAWRVYESKTVLSSSIDYIVSIEHELFKSKDRTLETPEWIAAFKDSVLEDIDFLTICDPSKLDNQRNAMLVVSDQFNRLFDREHELVFKFYEATNRLVMELTDDEGQPLDPEFFESRDGETRGPFQEWLHGIEKATERKESKIEDSLVSVSRASESFVMASRASISSIWDYASNKASEIGSSAKRSSVRSRLGSLFVRE